MDLASASEVYILASLKAGGAALGRHTPELLTPPSYHISPLVKRSVYVMNFAGTMPRKLSWPSFSSFLPLAGLWCVPSKLSPPPASQAQTSQINTDLFTYPTIMVDPSLRFSISSCLPVIR